VAETTVHVRSAHDASFSVGWAGKHSLTIDRPEHEAGSGVGFSARELLLLALGACYANDLQQEATARSIQLHGVRIVVDCDWGDEPVRARNVLLSARVEAQASEKEILDLVGHIDRSGQVLNSLRLGTEVTLAECEAVEVEIEPEAS
jgi:uncharacterized OsmC-like protein